jgi:uncharacterized oligopeptide transporter (OPT) family protein
MGRIGTMVLTVILFVIGIIVVFLNPVDPMAISFGMFLVAVSVLSVAIQIYFPATPPSPVELRVVKRRATPKPRVMSKRKRKRKPKKRAKKAKRKKKRRKSAK